MTDSANSQEFETLLMSGGEHLRTGAVEKALASFEAALVLLPDHPKALGLLGLVHFRRSDYESALPVYEKLVVVQSDDASAWLNLGLIHLKLGDASKAITELARSRELDPSQARTVSYLGLAHARNGEYALAFEAFLQAGQADLAQEMEQHLSDDEREFIVARVSAAQVAERAKASTIEPPVAEVKEPTAAEANEPAAEPESEDAELDEEGDTQDIPPDESTVPSVAAEAASKPAARDPEDHVSMMFELPKKPPENPAKAGSEAIARAVDVVIPSSAAQSAVTRTASGHRAPQSVTEFATAALIRPGDGDHAFEISASGQLIVRSRDLVLTRTRGLMVSSGDLSFTVQSRRVRGAHIGVPLGGEEEPVNLVSGKGFLVLAPGEGDFSAVKLDHDILYLREDLVVAFEEALSWESGHVPGSDHTIPVVQFRGQGAVAIHSQSPLVAVKVSERPLSVAASAIGGWIGRVIPRIVSRKGEDGREVFAQCSGEGVVLLTDESRDASA